MLRRCLRIFQRSEPTNARTSRYFFWRRHRRKPGGQDLLPPGMRGLKRDIPEISKELDDGFVYALNRYEQVSRPGLPILCQSENFHSDILEVLAQGPGYTTYRVRVKVHVATTSILGGSEWLWPMNKDFPKKSSGRSMGACLQEPQGSLLARTQSLALPTQSAPERTTDLREACRMRVLQEGSLEKLATSIVPAFPGGHMAYISTFLAIHPAFSRAQQFLDEMLSRSVLPPVRTDTIRVFSAYGEAPTTTEKGDTPQEQIKKAIASVMGTWPGPVRYRGQPLRFPWFALWEAFVQVPFPSSRTELLWVQLEHLEATVAELEEPPAQLRSAPAAEGPASGQVPGPAVPLLQRASPPSMHPALEDKIHSRPAPGPALELQPSGLPALIGMQMESAPSPASHHPRAVTSQPLTFAPRMVAEQLTRMDVELFKKVLPHQCLGSVWSQANEPGQEPLAHTVHAAIAHFNRVTSCVVTTCLGEPSMTAEDRAKVVEQWIEVASECRALQNFSSLHAVLFALGSAPINRLQETWGNVSRSSEVTLQQLQKEEESSGRDRPIKKRLSRFATLMLGFCGVRKRPQKCIPFIGKILNELQVLDASMNDYVKGNKINPEKIMKEKKVLDKIILLQEVAGQYRIEPQEQFRAWFRALEQLNENESYHLSCQLEPQS